MQWNNLGPELMDLIPVGKVLAIQTALDCFTECQTKNYFVWKIICKQIPSLLAYLPAEQNSVKAALVKLSSLLSLPVCVYSSLDIPAVCGPIE